MEQTEVRALARGDNASDKERQQGRQCDLATRRAASDPFVAGWLFGDENEMRQADKISR